MVRCYYLSRFVPSITANNMSATPPMLNLLVLRVQDLELARPFYEALGIAFEWHQHGRGAKHLAGETVGNSALLELYPLREGQTPTTSVRIGFRVDAVDSCLDALLAAGGKVIEAPHDSDWGRRAVVQDPDGHKIELVTPGHAG